MRGTADEQRYVRQHSGWLIPLGLLAVIVVLCGAFLLFYLRPSAYRSAQWSPTAASDAVAVRIGGRSFAIPANYFAYGPAGPEARTQVALIALLPDFAGYSSADAARFADDGPDSALIVLRLRGDSNNLSETDRLARIYMPYIADPAGTPGPFGLTRYEFRDNSGYRNDDLFVGPAGAFLFLCVRPTEVMPGPTCLAIDRPIAPGVALSYRFKRARLAQWRAITGGVARLLAGFERPS